MKKGFQVLTALVLALMLIGLTFVITFSTVSQYYFGSTSDGTASTAKQLTQKTAELYAYLSHYYIGELDATAMEDAVCNAMVASVGDEWSYYISADDYQQHLELLQNAYVGIGITISRSEEDSVYTITDVTAGGPAAAAGLQCGDIITHVNTQDVTTLELTALRNLVRGEADTQVELTYLHDGETRTCTLTRTQIETTVVESQLLDNGLGYLHIFNFDGECANKTIAAIEALQAQGATGIIFDVRDNPGGLKDELVQLLDYLLPEGEIFHTIDYAGHEQISTSDAAYLALPMAVLVNEASYSAAEYFAATLQEYKAAIIVGTQTYGKGYFQSALQLSDGSAVNLSIGKYFTPQGKNLAGIGITPDVIISLSDAQAQQLQQGQLSLVDDPQLSAAILALNP